MSRSSADGQVEPIAALAAILALTAAFGVYGLVHARVPLGGSDPHPAATACARVGDALDPAPVDPHTLASATRGVAPDRSLNVTLRTATGRWTVGPPRPARADVASRLVPVRVGDRRVRPGRLVVAVWT